MLKIRLSARGIFFVGKPGELMRLLKDYASNYKSLKELLKYRLH